MGFEPTARKNHVQPATPFVDRSSRGVAVRLTACKKLTNLVALTQTWLFVCDFRMNIGREIHSGVCVMVVVS